MVTPQTEAESFPLPGYEDRLWTELAELHVEGSAAGAAQGRPQPSRRRRQRRIYLVGVGAVAAAVVAVVGLMAVGSRPDVQAGSPGTGATRPPDAVVVEELRYADGSTRTIWRDEATGEDRVLQRDASGNPVREGYSSGGPADTEPRLRISVDHQAGEYVEQRSGPTTTDPAAPPLPGNPLLFSPRADDNLHGRIEEGQLVADGTEVVDGHEMLRYRSPYRSTSEVCEAAAGQPDDMYLEDLCGELQMIEEGNLQGSSWMATDAVLVDPETFRPVRETGWSGPWGQAATTFTYLERTEENLSLLEITIPEDYREVDHLGGSAG